MGVSFCWEPVKRGHPLSVGARSKFLEALNSECGDGSPWFLSEQHIGFLRGLAAAESDFQEAVSELTEAIMKHKEIRVWGEW